MTNRERILALIRNRPGLTDTEIRQRTGIEPHQQVNQICRALASGELIERVTGPNGRIINLPAADTPRPEHTSSPSSSVPSAQASQETERRPVPVEDKPRR